MRIGQKSSFLDGVEQVSQGSAKDATPQGELYGKLTSYLAISERRSGDQQLLEQLRAEIIPLAQGIINPEEANPDSPYVIQIHRGTRSGKHSSEQLQEHHIFFSDGICLKMQQVDRVTTRLDHFRAWLDGSIAGLELDLMKAENSIDLTEEEYRRQWGYAAKRFSEEEAKKVLAEGPTELSILRKLKGKLAEFTSVEVDWRITPDSPAKRQRQAAARRVKRRRG
jgi:hypothetical protein